MSQKNVELVRGAFGVLREGRAASLRGFLDQREALAAAGLEK
jgi:hypothetical protein